MLICYGDEVRLPQTDLAYVGFRLAAVETLSLLEITQEPGNEAEGPFGYLTEVPFLEQVAPAVQVDLLADVWRRHQDAAPHEASLLDAATVYAAFETASRVVSDEPELARLWLKAGPQRVRCRLGSRTAEQLNDLFFDFWDDIDFLSIEALQDLVPDHARTIRALTGLSEEDTEEMEEALNRWRASPAVLANLEGLLTGKEIQGYGRLLVEHAGGKEP
jgi:hypothetical protein